MSKVLTLARVKRTRVQVMSSSSPPPATGVAYPAPAPEPRTAAFELVEGDEVVVPSLTGTPVYSIRERRVIRGSR